MLSPYVRDAFTRTISNKPHAPRILQGHMRGVPSQMVTTNWHEALRHIVATPQGFQQWITVDDAQSVLRCDEIDLREIATIGLAMVNGHYEASDVWNLALHSNSGNTRPELEMKYFNLLLKSATAWIAPSRCAFSIRCQCPNGVDCKGGSWYPPDFDLSLRPGPVNCRSERSWSCDVVLVGHESAIKSNGVRLLWMDYLSQLRFHYTNPDLALQPETTLSRGVGDCKALSVALAHGLRDRGYVSRVRQGYLLGDISARVHYWVEVIEEGDWKELDLSMAILCDRFFTSDYREFCFGSTLNRLLRVKPSGNALVRHCCGDSELELKAVVTTRFG